MCPVWDGMYVRTYIGTYMCPVWDGMYVRMYVRVFTVIPCSIVSWCCAVLSFYAVTIVSASLILILFLSELNYYLTTDVS